MANSILNDEEESFIILGPNSGAFDGQCNGSTATAESFTMKEVLQDVPGSLTPAFKAHFQLSDSPSPASLMTASTIITDDSSVPDLQQKFGEILDENVILKETLRQNNTSMKDQMCMLASIQDDLHKTRKLHKDKFDETKEVIEKLRAENAQLKSELTKLSDGQDKSMRQSHTSHNSLDSNNCTKSIYEFVSSPDDDTINKLTEQLERVEKQRRAVIVENEKLVWQKESLEQLVDSISKERDELKQQLVDVQFQKDKERTELQEKISNLESKINEQESIIKEKEANGIAKEELLEKDRFILSQKNKITSLQDGLKESQLKVLELENVKLENSLMKNDLYEKINFYKSQMEQLQNRLKDAHMFVPQPVSKVSPSDTSDLSNNIRNYDQTLKSLAETINRIVASYHENISKTVELIVKASDLKQDSPIDSIKEDLNALKSCLEREQNDALMRIGSVKLASLNLEQIFEDCKSLLQNNGKVSSLHSKDADDLNSKINAKNEELKSSEKEIQLLKNQLAEVTKKLDDAMEQNNIMTVRLDLYKSDFEAERTSREELASNREGVLAELRISQRTIEELKSQLEEVRRLNSNTKATATAKSTKTQSWAGNAVWSTVDFSCLNKLEEVRKLNPNIYATATTKRTRSQSSAGNAGGFNMVYVCPKCNAFSCTEYNIIERHLDSCLDF